MPCELLGPTLLVGATCPRLECYPMYIEDPHLLSHIGFVAMQLDTTGLVLVYLMRRLLSSLLSTTVLVLAPGTCTKPVCSLLSLQLQLPIIVRG